MQAKDYKLFPPDVTEATADWEHGLTIDEMPLNAAICEPAAGAVLPAGPSPSAAGRWRAGGRWPGSTSRPTAAAPGGRPSWSGTGTRPGAGCSGVPRSTCRPASTSWRCAPGTGRPDPAGPPRGRLELQGLPQRRLAPGAGEGGLTRSAAALSGDACQRIGPSMSDEASLMMRGHFHADGRGGRSQPARRGHDRARGHGWPPGGADRAGRHAGLRGGGQGQALVGCSRPGYASWRGPSPRPRTRWSTPAATPERAAGGDPSRHLGLALPALARPILPAGHAPGRLPAYYAGLLDTVEINNTFYRLATSAGSTAWRDATPPGFLFAAKGSRFVTHMKKLKDPEEGLRRFFAPAGPAGREARAGRLPAPAALARRPRPPRRLPPGAAARPALRLRVPRRELARAGHLRAAGAARGSALPLGPGRPQLSRAPHRRLRLRPPARAGRPLPGQLRRRGAGGSGPSVCWRGARPASRPTATSTTTTAATLGATRCGSPGWSGRPTFRATEARRRPWNSTRLASARASAGPRTPSPARLARPARRAPRRPGCAGRVTFEPGARTAWHTHPLGQTLHRHRRLRPAQRAAARSGHRAGRRVWIPPARSTGTAPRPTRDGARRHPGGGRAGNPCGLARSRDRRRVPGGADLRPVAGTAAVRMVQLKQASTSACNIGRR